MSASRTATVLLMSAFLLGSPVASCFAAPAKAPSKARAGKPVQKPAAPGNVMEALSKAFFQATATGNQAPVRALLARVTDVHQKDSIGMTPMAFAAGSGQKDFVVKFLGMGAKADEGLVWAAQYGRLEAVKLLLDRGAKPNGSEGVVPMLMCVASDQALAIARELLAHGADPGAVDQGGSTPIMGAALTGKEPLLKLLLERKVNVNVQNSEGMTALLMALQAHSNDAAKLLLQHGADPNLMAKDGTSALFLARLVGEDPELLAALTKAGAKLGPISLSQAISISDEEAVRAAIKRGEDPNKKDDEGSTPLLSAMSAGLSGKPNPAVVRTLLDAGAAMNVADKEGDTPLLKAALFKYPGAVKMLLDKGAEVNVRDNEGITPLIAAAGAGSMESVQALLAKGADVNARTADGTTALKAAAMGLHTDVVRALKAAGAK